MEIIIDMSEAVEHPCEECMADEAVFRLGAGGELCAACVSSVPQEHVHWVSIAFQKRRH